MLKVVNPLMGNDDDSSDDEDGGADATETPSKTAARDARDAKKDKELVVKFANPVLNEVFFLLF